MKTDGETASSSSQLTDQLDALKKEMPVFTDDEKLKKRNDMKQFLDKMIGLNGIVLKEAQTRNIIFVGKTRSGKSTALSVLKHPFNFVRRTSIYSDTMEPKINHFTVEIPKEDKTKMNFNISIIDTPGLFEVRDKGSLSRDNECLQELVLKCMKSEITKIHQIFFVLAYNGVLMNEDILALERFIKLFDGAQGHIHILVTKSEKLSEDEKVKFEREFREYPKMKDLLKVINPKMYFFGAVENSDYENCIVDGFKQTLPHVMIMRVKLFDDIFSNTKHFELNSLKMVDQVRVEAQNVFEVIQNQFRKKEDIQINYSIFEENCKKLGNWLPLLEPAKYEAANTLLMDCEKYVSALKNNAKGKK